MLPAPRTRSARLIPAGLLLALTAGLALPSIALAMSAEEAFSDGNRLFRDDLYWAALLRYEQAADAGMDTPLLHYNVGVAHYKARQYDRAAEAFEKAARSPRLAVIAHYNLGLTAFAAGKDAEALRWLQKSRDQEENGRMRKLSIEAIAAIREAARKPEPEVPVVVADEGPKRKLERDPRPFAKFDVYASAGFGNDSNVYRTPSESYVDLSIPGQPVQIDPVVQTGSFVPVRVGAKYTVNSFEYESFFARYRGAGRFYPDELLTNADEYIQELAIGTEYERDRENRESRVFSAFTIGQHHETYFDPDDGTGRVIDGVDIGDRLSYLRYGPEISTRQSWTRFTLGLWGKAQLWNYKDVEVVPAYDHEYFRIGTNLQYRLTQTSLVRLVAEAYQRNFSNRPSFDLDGNQLITNPAVEYQYIDYSVVARQRVTRGFWFGVKYMTTERRDMYVGYNDYTRDGFGAELHFQLGDRFRMHADALYRIYNFTNAFAYNNAAAERKTLETADGSIRAELDLSWNLRLVGEFTIRDVASNDARIAYDRSVFLLSLQWDHD